MQDSLLKAAVMIEIFISPNVNNERFNLIVGQIDISAIVGALVIVSLLVANGAKCPISRYPFFF